MACLQGCCSLKGGLSALNLPDGRGVCWWVRKEGSGGEAEATQHGEGPDALLCPGRVRLEAKVRAAASPHQAPGHVQEHEPQALGLGGGELALEAQALGPGDEVLGDGHHLDPHGVVRELVEGEVAQPGVLGAADAVLHPGMAAVACLQVGEVVVGRVGEEDLVAPPLGIEEGEMGTGMRFLPPADGPGALRPGGKIEQTGQLGDSCSGPQPAVLSMASTHAPGGTSRMATCTASVTSKPT